MASAMWFSQKKADGTGREYFLYNATGTTSALTDDDGVVTSTSCYTAWGIETATQGETENIRKFNTKERSELLGIDYFGFRYYDPGLGRFLTRDPAGYPDGPNNYLYCDNNPVNKIDALGLYSWWDDVIGTATEFSKMAWQGTKEVASIIGEGSAAVVTGKSSVKDLAADTGKNVVDKIDGVIEKNANRISAQVEGGSSWAGATVATAGAMVGDVIGYTPLLEGAHGTDLASGQQLSEVDRASRMLTGGGQLILSGIALQKGLVSSDKATNSTATQIELRVKDGQVSVSLNSSDVRFTQDSISANFRDGRSVQELIDNMRSGSVVPDDLPALRVFEENGKIYSLDNRRLFAAKESKIR